MTSDESAPKWYIPVIEVKLPDGATLIKPGKAVRRGTAAQVSRWTGVSVKILARLADCGLITCSRPSVKITWYYPSEVEELIERTRREPDFWTEVRRRAFLDGTDLGDSKSSK